MASYNVPARNSSILQDYAPDMGRLVPCLAGHCTAGFGFGDAGAVNFYQIFAIQLAFILKPFTQSHFSQKIRKVLDASAR